MLFGAIPIEISNIQEDETEGALTRGSECYIGLKTAEWSFGMHNNIAPLIMKCYRRPLPPQSKSLGSSPRLIVLPSDA